LRKYERLVVKVLLVMIKIVVLNATLEFRYLFVKDIVKPPVLLLEIDGSWKFPMY
jgi:hypothetical protein